MKAVWKSVVVLALLATAVAGYSDSRAKSLRATLNGYQEVPAVSTTGNGEFRARIDRSDSSVSFLLIYSDLEAAPSAAHIHLGQRGVSGGVMSFLCGGPRPACPPSGTVSGVIGPADIIGPAGQGIAAGEFDEFLRALRSGNAYVNVHTSKHPGGEIRGQIRDEDDM